MSAATLAMARLIELDDDFAAVKDGGKSVEVQFNPETLKLAFANEVQQPEGGDQAGGTAGQQFVGAGSTTLTVTLWFDVTALETDPVDDVRRKTADVLYFMTPKPFSGDETKFVPPAVRFQWANLIFDGLVTSMEENLEFFSPEGKPLRANMALGFTQQKILVSDFAGDGRVPQQQGARPLEQASEGDSVQKMAGKKGKHGDWQPIAAANGIEDPLRMPLGKLIDLNARLPLPQIESRPQIPGPGPGNRLAPAALANPFSRSARDLPPLALPSVITPPLPRLRID